MTESFQHRKELYLSVKTCFNVFVKGLNDDEETIYFEKKNEY